MSCSVYEWGLARSSNLFQAAFIASISLNTLLSRSSNFSRSLCFWRIFVTFSKTCKFGVLQALLSDWLRVSHQVVRKKSIVYFLLCRFINIIINIFISSDINICISINSFALLNCLYFNPCVLPFVYFSSPFCWGSGGEGRAK